MTTYEKTTLIFERILVHLNGYSEKDAKRYAESNNIYELWEEIENIIDNKYF